jgi:hypothetical protein
MPEPSIGRIVHYVSYGTPGGEYISKCRAAIIAEVSTKRTDPSEVGLCVLNPTGIFFDRQVRLSQEAHTGGTWHWPEHVEETSDDQSDSAV